MRFHVFLFSSYAFVCFCLFFSSIFTMFYAGFTFLKNQPVVAFVAERLTHHTRCVYGMFIYVFSYYVC